MCLFLGLPINPLQVGKKPVFIFMNFKLECRICLNYGRRQWPLHCGPYLGLSHQLILLSFQEVNLPRPPAASCYRMWGNVSPCVSILPILYSLFCRRGVHVPVSMSQKRLQALK